MDLQNSERVLKKSEFIMDIIKYITKNCLKGSNNDNKNLTNSKKDYFVNSSGSANKIAKILVKTNYIGDNLLMDYEDPGTKYVLLLDFTQ